MFSWNLYELTALCIINLGIFVTPGTSNDQGLANSSAADISNDKEIVTYSVMFYYTPELAANIDDVDDYITNIVGETNEGN